MIDAVTPSHASSERIQDLLQTAFDQRVSDINKSQKTAQKALDLATQTDDVLLIAEANNHLAFFHMIKGEHDQARLLASLAKPVLEKFNKYSSLGLLQYTIGSTYYKTEDYHTGLKHLTDSYLVYQKSNDKVGQSRALKAIGTIYEFFKEYDSAQETYEKCVEISLETGDMNGASNAYNNLSGVYLRKGNLEQASSVIEKSISLKSESGDQRGLAFALYGKAKVLMNFRKYHKAEELYLESLRIFVEVKEEVGTMMCHNKLGELYFTLDQIELAKQHLNSALDKGSDINHYLIMHKACYNLYLIERSLDHHLEALEFLEQHLAYKDKVINKETKNVIQSIKAVSKMEMLEQEARWQKEKKEEVELKNAELDTFVYKVSHDLRGPISSLLGLYQVVNMEVTDPQSVQYFDMYHTQIQRLNGILMDFISLTQIKEKAIQPTQIDLKNVVRESIDAYQYFENFNDIEFKINIAVDYITSDKTTIVTIIQNLIENAIKYSRKETDPYVDISISSQSQEIEIKVEDNGIGIADEFQPKVFEMFYRANDVVQGTGLGLYILKNAVDKLRGAVHFESKLNQGSCFKITIPATV